VIHFTNFPDNWITFTGEIIHRKYYELLFHIKTYGSCWKKLFWLRSSNWLLTSNVRYHSGGSMKLNACILFLAHMVYI
jgi:hypothetical protein